MRPKSLSIPDARGAGASLRVTRHPEERKVILSHWRGDVCVASIRVEPTQLPTLIGLLAEALGDAIDTNSQTTPTTRTRWQQLATVVRQWVRPRLAHISELRLHGGPHADKEVG
jgi:hypothetical protein